MQPGSSTAAGGYLGPLAIFTEIAKFAKGKKDERNQETNGCQAKRAGNSTRACFMVKSAESN